jgi:hypothetical protein
MIINLLSIHPNHRGCFDLLGKTAGAGCSGKKNLLTYDFPKQFNLHPTANNGYNF